MKLINYLIFMTKKIYKESKIVKKCLGWINLLVVSRGKCNNGIKRENSTGSLSIIKEAKHYIDKKTKSRRVATYVSGTKEKFGDSAVRSSCINCGENHHLDGCLKFMDMALKDRIKKKYCF